MAAHWSARGYVVVNVQHPGSDETVWKEAKLKERLNAMRKAASIENLKARVQDIPAVIDQLTTWNTTASHPLSGRLDLTRLGMCGHSFGARTTQIVSGEKPVFGQAFKADERIKAAMPLSPSPPSLGDPKKAFSGVKIPWMLMTGTKDVAAIGNTTVEDRLAVFPALPPGKKFEVVLHEAEHSAFSERALPGDKIRRNPNHHRVILALGTAFWDAYLLGDQKAEAWLMGDGPKSVLEPKDRWQMK
jgi:predicted dienelactone hydrolase